MLELFAQSLYVAEGPSVPFLGIPYPTRMAVVKLESGSLWVWSPIALSPELERDLIALGPVEHVISPNKIHHLFLAEWAERFPDARFYAPPGLAKRKPQLHFDFELGEAAPSAWTEEIDQTVFKGSFAMDEVLFFHRPSKTAIRCDLVQRHDASDLKPMHRWLMWADGLLGENGSTPREWRFTFWRRNQTRVSRSVVLDWKPENLIIAHGTCAKGRASEILSQALAWA
ncbi:MAG: DUF4336 domain-containing protein [Myxococcota bacterium]|nr:DUF4336 domain-containing protein [Myxococcota bacterium]